MLCGHIASIFGMADNLGDIWVPIPLRVGRRPDPSDSCEYHSVVVHRGQK